MHLRHHRKHAAGLVLVPLTLLLSGCGSPDNCATPADTPAGRLLQALVCIGYTPPTIQAIIDVSSTTVVSGQPVSFSARRSYAEPYDFIVGYTWDFGDGSPQVNKGTIDFSESHTYSATASKQVTVRLVVQDEFGATAETSRVLTITPSPPQPPVDAPPVASFTATPNPTPPDQTVTFDGSGSSDPDGEIVNYHWDFGDTRSTDSAGSAPVLHAYTCTGTVNVTLTVTDDTGQTGPITHPVVVTPQPGFSACSPGHAEDARAAPMRRFWARFASAHVVRTGTLSRRGHVTTLRDLILAGGLDGQLIGSRTLTRFGRARWIAMLTVTANTDTRIITLHGLALATFRGAAPSSTACLRLSLTRRGTALPRGSFVLLAGTGEMARMSGGGTFAYELGRDGNGRFGGRLRSARRRPRPLPAACTQLSRTR
ncbi:MAG: PKD domain-containing protein [Solirubrobacteraceae bacterium]